MGNSVETKQKILEVAAVLFNTQGYKATSLSDITFASGYTKGAIYKHFRNKDMLEKDALMYMCYQTLSVLREKIKCENNAIDKMRAVFQYYISHVLNPIIRGGCPLMNAAIEMDDTNADMKLSLNQVLQAFHDSTEHILKNGIKYGQLSDKMETKEFSAFIIASLEGAIMMSKINGSSDYLKLVCSQLEKQIVQYST